MSYFTTPIPIDLESVKKLLPTGSDILGVEWNPTESRIDLRWSNERLKTPFTFDHHFPLDSLKAKKLPEKTQLVELGVVPPLTSKKTVDKSAVKKDKKA